jgi:tripartite-type tricarboxylate transporter receptor subunit TctC
MIVQILRCLLTYTMLFHGFNSMAQSASTNFPDKPIRIVVGYGPGGGTDLVARALAPALTKIIGQSVIVENKPGAGGSTGALFVAQAKPDGHTILLSSASSVIIAPTVNKKLSYKLGDFIALTQLTVAPLMIVVSKDLHVRTVAELIKLAKANPDKLNYASSGIGSGPHFGGVLFNEVAGTRMLHVPFRSGSASAVSVAAGETQVTFATTPSVSALLRAGQVIGIGVTSRENYALAPDLPGMIKAGLPNYQFLQWNGLFLPLGTAPEIIDKLFISVQAAMNTNEVKQILETDGTEVAISASPTAFVSFTRNESKFLEKLIKDSGLKSFE